MVRLVLPDIPAISLSTDRGVFSADGVDAGTVVLLRTVPPPPEGDLLDLGCGYGPIAIALALRQPAATVWALDVNERARALAAENAEASGLTNVRVVSPEDVPAELRFAAVYSNPPIRIGKPALHDLLTAWLERLRPGASGWLVVHKNLGSDSLADWLGANGLRATRVTSRRGYRVLEVSRS